MHTGPLTRVAPVSLQRGILFTDYRVHRSCIEHYLFHLEQYDIEPALLDALTTLQALQCNADHWRQWRRDNTQFMSDSFETQTVQYQKHERYRI